MKEEFCTSRVIIDRLKAAGYRAAFLAYDAITQITRTYDELYTGNGGIKFAQNAVNHFRDHQPPQIPFEPLSFLIIACPGCPAEIVFDLGEKRVAVPIPPTYIDDGSERQKPEDILEQTAKGFQTAHTRGISQKLLAVHSGLGRYGRNNICYIEGLGSYFSLIAYYTDIPCEGGVYPIRFLDGCETCGLCRQSCPTGAIGQGTVIDASRCLTLHNESKSPIPDWIPRSAHHTMIGCLRCQEVCPYNRAQHKKAKNTLELSPDQTKAILSSDSRALPEELKQKLDRFGLDEHFIAIAGRNAALALQNS